MSATAAPPLKGIKVIELGTLIAGPFCSRILAEFGAEVIKIEAPDGGDQLREWRKMYEGTSLWWYVQARNKKSVTVNLREPAGQVIVRKLCAEADIVSRISAPAHLRNGISDLTNSPRSIRAWSWCACPVMARPALIATGPASASSANRWAACVM